MARKTKQAEPADAQLEQVETGGLGIEEGIVLGTFFLLVAAIVVVILENQTYTI
jgi:hypothetical protein